MTSTARATSARVTDVEESPRILVGVDDSAESRAAVTYVTELAQHTPITEIVLAHAYEGWPTGTHDPTVDRLHAEAVERARGLVDDLAARIRAATTVPVRTVLSTERPARMLGVMSDEADLVVVGQDTAGLIERMTLGSIAARLASSAHCPVVVVPAPWHARQFGRPPVVVAVSGDDTSPAPLAEAIAEARRSRTGVLALHAIPYFADADEVAEHESDLDTIVTAARQAHPDVEITSLVVRGAPEEHLVRLSINACATVVGRTHQGGPTAWTRSVAHAVMKRTHCPLIIVPTA